MDVTSAKIIIITIIIKQDICGRIGVIYFRGCRNETETQCQKKISLLLLYSYVLRNTRYRSIRVYDLYAKKLTNSLEQLITRNDNVF